MLLFIVCLTGRHALSIADRIRSRVQSSKTDIRLNPKDCHAEIIFGDGPPQSNQIKRKVRFLQKNDLPLVSEDCRIWPEEPSIADQLILSCIESMCFEHLWKTSEEARLKSEERFRTTIINNSDILTLLDPSGKVLYHSASINQKMGYVENELEGKSLFEVIHPEDFPRIMVEFENALHFEGISKKVEFRFRNKNGEYLFIEAVGNNQLNNPLMRAFVVHSHDISERKREEEEKNKLIRELARQNNDLRNFAYITSHNLKTPFSNFQSILPFLQPNIPIHPELLTGLIHASNQLESTFDDLLRILLVREGPSIQIESVQLEPLLSFVLKRLSPEVREADAQIRLDIPPGAKVPFYEPYLREILEQLIRNALIFRHPGRVAEVKISLRKEKEEWHLQIADNGLGFDYEKVKERVFGFYQRFHRSSNGKGLGLFLSQTHALACFSTLECISREGVGSIFTLKIPELVQ